MTKILAIGDIHTKLWIIKEVRKLVDKYDTIVFVGDYADDWDKDGLDTIDTWHELYTFQKEYPEKVFLVLGNHDFIYINNTPSLQSGYNTVTKLVINSPNYKYLKDWLLSLPIVLEKDGITFSHAGIAKGWDGNIDVDSLWQDCSPIWVRPKNAEYLQVSQVFGHTPQSTCKQLNKGIWCIDTFSTYSDGSPIGDHTALQINNGKYRKIKINENTDNSSSKPN